MSRLELLVHELDEVRADIKQYERKRVECEKTLWELRNQEKTLKRQIEREAHLSL
jgi:hypothetical protein